MIVSRSSAPSTTASRQLVERREATATYRYCYTRIQVRPYVQSLCCIQMRVRADVGGQARRRRRP